MQASERERERERKREKERKRERERERAKKLQMEMGHVGDFFLLLLLLARSSAGRNFLCKSRKSFVQPFDCPINLGGN